MSHQSDNVSSVAGQWDGNSPDIHEALANIQATMTTFTARFHQLESAMDNLSTTVQASPGLAKSLTIIGHHTQPVDPNMASTSNKGKS